MWSNVNGTINNNVFWKQFSFIVVNIIGNVIEWSSIISQLIYIGNRRYNMNKCNNNIGNDSNRVE